MIVTSLMRKKDNDAFGSALLTQYLNPKDTVFEIIEREDGYIEAGMIKDYIQDTGRYEGLKRVLPYLHGKIIDVGCGAGRTALQLQKKGFDVTGIDISKKALLVAKKLGLKKAQHISLEKLLKNKQLPFTTFLFLGHNFGIFENWKKARRLLKLLFDKSPEDAILIAETMDPYGTNNPDHLWYHHWNRKRDRMPGQIKLRIRHKKIVGEWFDYLFVSRSEMKELLKDTGWKIIKILPSIGESYTVVLRKR